MRDMAQPWYYVLRFIHKPSHYLENRHIMNREAGLVRIGIFSLWTIALLASPLHANTGEHSSLGRDPAPHIGYPVRGTSIQVFVEKGHKDGSLKEQQEREAVDTVVKALDLLIQHRHEFARVDEALKQDLLERIVIEPRVINREGKEFPFLVARTQHKGKVKLLINAAQLAQNGYLNHPDALMPRLAKEFQWVVSKANTSAKARPASIERDLRQAPIYTNAEIQRMTPEERQGALMALLEHYLTTSDEQESLTSQPYYEQGTTTLHQPDQPSSTTRFYDIKIREALQLIVRERYFQEMTPKAIRNLLNGKIWNVAFVKIDSRDWTTRTRVLPKDQAVEVGKDRRRIQPAKVLINYHRILDKQDPLFLTTQGLPMGALSAEQLARVIAWEIQNQITEKSMQGHVAEDEKSTPE